MFLNLSIVYRRGSIFNVIKSSSDPCVNTRPAKSLFMGVWPGRSGKDRLFHCLWRFYLRFWGFVSDSRTPYLDSENDTGSRTFRKSPIKGSVEYSDLTNHFLGIGPSPHLFSLFVVSSIFSRVSLCCVPLKGKSWKPSRFKSTLVHVSITSVSSRHIWRQKFLV